MYHILLSTALLLAHGEAPHESEVSRQPLMRRHHARVASISHAAVIAPEHGEFETIAGDHGRAETWHRAILANGDIEMVGRPPKDTHAQIHSHKFVSPKEDVHPDGLWLGFLLSALGTLVTFVYLRKVWDRPAATEESSPPRPGTITSTLQILCITSLNVSYGAMISSMTIFVLPKEAEHFYPRQSSLGLGLLEFVAAVCLLCGPVAGQISDRIKHPMGRRRPMVLICSQMAVTATFGLWFSSRYNSSMAFLTCLFLQQIAWNSTHAAHSALLSDLIHPACIGLASSIQTINVLVGGMLGMLSFQGLAQRGLNNNYIYAAQAVATYLLLPVTQFAAQEAGSHDMLLPSNAVSLWKVFQVWEAKSPDFVLVMWERGFYYACTACKSFLVYFARDMLQMRSDKDQAVLLAEASVGTVLAAVLGGFLSSVLFTRTSIRPQTVACGGSLLLAVGTKFWTCLFFHGVEARRVVLLLFFCIYGFGKGSYMSADLTLAIDTLPNVDEASKYLGLWGLSAFLGAGLGGLAMSIILELFGQVIPTSYGMKVKPGTYCVHGYICLLLLCFVFQLYVAYLCLQIRTRRDESKIINTQRRKTNAFLVESDDRWAEKMPEETAPDG